MCSFFEATEQWQRDSDFLINKCTVISIFLSISKFSLVVSNKYDKAKYFFAGVSDFFSFSEFFFGWIEILPRFVYT